MSGPTPQQIKNHLIAREAAWDPNKSVRLIEEEVTAGLDKAYASRRDEIVNSTPTTGAQYSADHAMEQAQKLAAQHQAKIVKRAIPRKEPVRRAEPVYTCRKCGQCRRCRRELRAMNILTLSHHDDSLKVLAGRIIGAALRAQSGSGEFTGLSDHDANRVMTRIVEDVCDASIPLRGPWL